MNYYEPESHITEIHYICIMIEEKENNIRRRRAVRVAVAIMSFWIGSIIIIEILLSTPLVTNTVNRTAGRYIDGDISFGKVSASLLKNFPAATITLEDLCITYPSDRFDISEAQGPQGALMHIGCGAEADTLAAFSRFSASVNITPIIFGSFKFPEISLESPRIYAHSYADGMANWNIFRTGSEAGEAKDSSDSTQARIPGISVGKISLTDGSRIVYTNSSDTVFTIIELNKAVFDGRLATRKTSRNRVGLSVDSLFAAGRIAADTLAFGLDRLRIHEHGNHMDVHMQAKTLIASRTFGRMNVPIELGGTLHFPKDSVLAVGVHDFRAEIAAIPFAGEADLRFHEDRTEIDGKISVKECKADDILKKFVRNFIPEASKIKTDAIISINALCKGDYIHKTGKLPEFSIKASMPRSRISHSDIGEDVSLALDAYLANTGQGRMDITVNEMEVTTSGLDIQASGAMSDLMSEDPSISIDGSIRASLDTLAHFLPDSLNMTAEGSMQARISGKARLSDLSIYTFSQSELTGEAESDKIVLSMPDDSLNISIEKLNLNLGPESITSRRDTAQSFRLMGITGKIGKIDASYKGGLSLKGTGITLTAKNSADESDTSKVGRLGGRLSAQDLKLTDASGTSIDLDETQNGFLMMPKRDNPKIPVLTLTSRNKRIIFATDVNRAILTDASLRASASMNSIERRQRVRDLRDSLAKAYPEVPEDSLFFMLISNRQVPELPEWLQDEDFRSRDIDIRLDKSLAKYFRDWDMRGNLDVRTGILMTPYFPLRNILRGMHVSFTNDRIGIDSLKIMAGKSGIAAKGELTGLRRALSGGVRGRPSRSVLKLDLGISTDGMNANEILTAYNAGSRFDPDATKDKMSDASNAEFLQMVISDTSAAEAKASLLVIPANINADIRLDGKNITYSDLSISSLNASLLMKERCVQITNTMATSNIGDVSFEGFYSTRTKKDIKAGFNFEFNDITAEKAIGLMPAVDTIMPLLKSFAGQLDCELAATASLDTNMNILTPTINGVLRISGNDLTISNSDMFTSLAKKLKFDNNKAGRINKMTVEGVIKDNVLEVFPFVLSLDRYTLAMSGKQNLDMSYRYHASIIKSPLIIKIGVDVYGKDFDNMKFKIGKPKYKNEKVPVFTSVIDQTRINLAKSIRGIFEKGVDAAVQENEKQEALKALSKEIGYVNAVDQTTEDLSAEEQKELEAATSNEEATENQQNNE